MSIIPSTITVKPPVVTLIACIIIGGVFYLAGKHLEVRQPDHATINVTADAKVSAAPDIAVVNLGVQSGRQGSAKAAVANISENMTKIIAALKAAGIEDKDVSTSQFSLNPSYDYVDGAQILRGYEANQSLEVKIRDLEKIGDVLSASTNAGANQVGNISFTIDNPDAAKATARQMAIDEAKQKAKDLAASLGVRLGRLRGFSEEGYNMSPQPMMALQAERSMDVGSIQIPTGEQDIRVNVTLTYDIK